MNKINIGNELRKMRKHHTITCNICGKVFDTMDARAKFCCNACRCAAYRERRSNTALAKKQAMTIQQGDA